MSKEAALVVPTDRRRPRRTERIVRPDGTPVPMRKPARADLLRYQLRGGGELATVLVRRTHDVAYARELAVRCWAQAGLVGELGEHRVGFVAVRGNV